MTVTERVDAQTAIIKIPNGEVMAEFFNLYQKNIIPSTSYMDANMT